MKFTCNGCGGQEFNVLVREYDAHARTNSSTNMVQEVDKVVCADCGKEHHI